MSALLARYHLVSISGYRKKKKDGLTFEARGIPSDLGAEINSVGREKEKTKMACGIEFVCWLSGQRLENPTMPFIMYQGHRGYAIRVPFPRIVLLSVRNMSILRL